MLAGPRGDVAHARGSGPHRQPAGLRRRPSRLVRCCRHDQGLIPGGGCIAEGLGITPVMLTGDNQATATAIAHEAGIAEARGNLLPEDKLEAIKALQAKHGLTAMTSDGINDAPALAQADIGVAMGAAGTAMEAADVVVMIDDLCRIAETVRLSRSTHAVLWQNITLALGIKAVFLVLAVLGNASMWMEVFANMGASLLVVLNGLRLLGKGESK